ncbi:MAG: hypothetical protein O7A04_02130 [Acidobacteria bacterium]|nr:hypothetical protein [Acidobacteriota bacterium]
MMDPAGLGRSYRAALLKQPKDSDAPLDSNLEARFSVLLKSKKVPRWTRPRSKDNPLALILGTGHRPDFLWTNQPTKGDRKTRVNLAVFIDGPVHGLKNQFGKTLRRVNLCSLLLGPEWTVFQFAVEQLELGADVVQDWHLGRLKSMIENLRSRQI